MKKVSWKKISEFEGPEQSPGFLLWQVSTQWRRKIENALSTLDLTHSQFVLLASVGWLTKSGAEVTQIMLAKHCGTDINMTSQVLRALERRGFIVRYQREGDERAKYLRITEKGAGLVEQAIPIVEEVDRNFFSILKDTKICMEILQKLIDR